MRLRISVDPSGTSASGRLLLSLDISYSIRWKWRQEGRGRGREEKSRKKETLCSEQVIESGQLIVRVLARFFVNPLLTESIHPQPAATAQAVRLLSLVKS